MKTLVAAALTLALLGGVATTTQADERHSGNDKSRYERRDHDKNDHRNDSRDRKHDNDKDRDWHRNDHPQHSRYDYDHHKHGHYVKPPGYRYRAWRHGDRLPSNYRSSRYIVNDYHTYRLRTPPRGYHWVRVDKDVILAAVATGLVAQAIYGIF